VDERYIMHRYYSTRLATLVGAVLMGGWILYEFWGNGHLRLDLLVIMGVMALVKVGAMIFYRITN
jgi:hypothetical protein